MALKLIALLLMHQAKKRFIINLPEELPAVDSQVIIPRHTESTLVSDFGETGRCWE